MNPERWINIIIMVFVFGLIFCVWCICVCLWVIKYLRKVRFVRTKLGIDDEKIKEDESNILRLWCDSHQDNEPIEPTKKTTLSAYMKSSSTQSAYS